MTLDSSKAEFSHEPVLLNEVIEGLNLKDNDTFVDGTLGGGGHAGAILKNCGNGIRLIGIDRDESALRRCKGLLKLYGGRVELVNDRYENIGSILSHRKVEGILLDLGVSSFMLDDPKRGFSLKTDGPLDMRMFTK